MTQVIFLGTAGSSAVFSKQLRSSGGIIIQKDDLQFHIDPGPGALNKARDLGINVNNTTAVLVSHHHLNHCNDLNAVIEGMTHGGIEQRGIVMGSKSTLQGVDGHAILTPFHRGLVERIIPLEKNHKVGIDVVEINALAVNHVDPTAVGFKFRFPHFVISYPGDTIVDDQLLQELEGTDLLILNVPYPGNRGKGMNLDTEAAMKIVQHIRPRLAILTHFGLEMLKADPLVEAREIQRITGVQTIAAQDGLMIAPDNYDRYRAPVKGYS